MNVTKITEDHQKKNGCDSKLVRSHLNSIQWKEIVEKFEDLYSIKMLNMWGGAPEED